MSYANLNIVINTNAAQAAQSMSGFGTDARQALGSVVGDVERFRQSMIDATAANDAVIGKAQETRQAIEAVGQATDNINPKSFADKLAAAFGAGYAATQTWLKKTEELGIF